IWSRQQASQQARIKALRDENRAARERIKTLSSHRNKSVLYSIQAFVAASKREALQRQLEEERQQLRTDWNSGSVGTWHQWISSQAATGNSAEVAALRRIHYRELAERLSNKSRVEIGIVTGLGAVRKPV